jgi:hypothetical protein
MTVCRLVCCMRLYRMYARNLRVQCVSIHPMGYVSVLNVLGDVMIALMWVLDIRIGLDTILRKRRES